MNEIIGTLALELAQFLLREFLNKLQEKLSNSTQEEIITQEQPIFKLKIGNAEIIDKIGQIWLQHNEKIINELKNNTETNEISNSDDGDEIRDKFTDLVLRELEKLSQEIFERNPKLVEFKDKEIKFLQPPREEIENIDQNELMLRVETLERSLNEIAENAANENKALEKVIPENSQPTPLVDNQEQISPVQEQKPQVQSSENPEYKKIRQELGDNKAYGASVLQILNKFNEEKPSLKNQSEQNEILDNTQLQECLKELERAAEETVELESSPIKIGIMGEFSSGKSRLIESLIGYGGILPVGNTATTGNITAIHLIPQDGFKTTHFEKFEVEYLSQEEVKKCLKFMFGEADKLLANISNSELPNSPTVDSTDKLDDNLLLDWENWCKEVWGKNKYTPDLHNLLVELVTLIRTYKCYQADLYGNEIPKDNIYDINRDTAYQGLKLNNESTADNFDNIPQINKVTFNPDQLSLDFLESSFSLIRRINIYVKISSEIWKIATTENNNQENSAKFILLDFPGSGASKSKMRDTFVSEQELKEIQTNLFLLNGSLNPGSDRANKILEMVRKIHGDNLKDRILVGVSQFNLLLERISKEKGELDTLINDNQSLTEAKVLEKLTTLNAFIDDAKRLGSEKENIVFLDQHMALKFLQENSPETVQAGSDKFLADELDNPDLMNLSKEMSQKWRRLSEILPRNSSSSLGKQLGYFAQDGGIDQLRNLLLKHVAAHALKQNHEASSRAADNLDEQQQQLRKILKEEHKLIEESQDLKNLRSYLDKMYSSYNRFKDNELGKEPLKYEKKVAVSDVVKDEVTYRILDWKQWNLLFSRAKNGRILISSRNKGNSGFLKRKRGADKIPTKSDDFYEEFKKTVEELQEFADNCIKKAVEKLLDKRSKKLSEEIAHLKKILPQEDDKIEEMYTEVENKLGGKQAELFSFLDQSYDPKKWQESIIEKAFEDKKPIETATAFPLAYEDKQHNHNNGQIFEWAPEYGKINQNPQSFNQLILVQRLRDEITAAISLQLIEYVSKINKKVEEQIVNILDEFLPELNTLLKEDALLRYIAKDEQESKDDPISEILSKIVFISRPDKS
ncbi:MAG: dynamin family protein [Cyanobacteria bacterium P01_A01_bin.83]